MPDASALIAAPYGLGRAGLIDSLLELGHALAVAGHVEETELRGRETGERTECMVRQDKMCILGGSTAAGLRGMGGRALPGLDLGECDMLLLLLLHERARRQGRSYGMLDDRAAGGSPRAWAYRSRAARPALASQEGGGVAGECGPARPPRIWGAPAFGCTAAGQGHSWR